MLHIFQRKATDLYITPLEDFALHDLLFYHRKFYGHKIYDEYNQKNSNRQIIHRKVQKGLSFIPPSSFIRGEQEGS